MSRTARPLGRGKVGRDRSGVCRSCATVSLALDGAKITRAFSDQGTGGLKSLQIPFEGSKRLVKILLKFVTVCVRESQIEIWHPSSWSTFSRDSLRSNVEHADGTRNGSRIEKSSQKQIIDGAFAHKPTCGYASRPHEQTGSPHLHHISTPTTTVIMDTKTRSNFLARVLVAAVLCSHAIGVKATYAYFAGYEPP